MDNQVKLGVLRIKDYDYEVFAWGSYGVVCPDLVTTNGSIPYLSKYIEERVAAGMAEWRPADICGDGTVYDQLRRAWMSLPRNT